MRFLKSFSTGFVSGVFLGWLFGALEGAVHLAWYLGHEFHGSGTLPPIALADLAGIPLMAGALYAAVLAPISALLALLLGPVLRRLPSRMALPNPWEAAAASALAAVLFLNLYWWTRPILFYGLRFHDPRRIAAAAVMAAAALVGAWLLVKGLRRPAARLFTRPALPAIVLLVAMALSAVFFLREESLAAGGAASEPDGEWTNVVLLVPDALRADHLGCYGYDPYARPVSPFLDRLAKESVLFEHAVTQAPYTWTSFGSFLTGKFPRKHGLLKMDPTQRLDPKDNVTLAEILDGGGYTCGAFLMGTLSNNSGLLQGFDIYFEAIVGHDPVSIHSKWSIFKSDLVMMRLYNKIKQARDPALVNTLARAFVREMKDRPFFLMVHYYATHTPYDPPEPYKSMYDPAYEGAFTTFTQAHNFAVQEGRLPLSDRDLQRIVALYDGGVTFQDDMAAGLHATLEEEGVLDRTLLIFTSDHGEELYDHAVFEHDWMFNTNQLVPLIIRFPGGRFAGERVRTPVALIDLLPTVMDVTGISPPEAVMREVDGRSLLRLLEEGAAAPREPHYRFCENNRYLSVQDERFKLIRYRHEDRQEPDRLYHIEKDPGETANVIGGHPEEYERLSKALEAYDRSMPADTRTYESDPELKKRLFELGYIQGNAPVLEGELERRKKQ